MNWSIIVTFLCVSLNCLSQSQIEARKELVELEISFTKEEYLNRIIDDDILAIDLFIKAGMEINPEAINKKSRYTQSALDVIINNESKQVLNYFLKENLIETYNEYLVSRIIKEDKNELLFIFLDNGLEINSFYRYYNNELTLLMLAAKECSVECVKLLLEQGANPKTIEKEPFMRVHYGSRSYKSKTPIKYNAFDFAAKNLYSNGQIQYNRMVDRLGDSTPCATVYSILKEAMKK